MRDGHRWTAAMEPSLQMNLSKRKIPIIVQQILIIAYRAPIFIRFFCWINLGYKQLLYEIRIIIFIWKILYLISLNKVFIFVPYWLIFVPILMFPYSSVPLLICSLTYMFPYSYVPLLICSLTHLFPYLYVPLLICSLTHLFPYSSVPLLICSLTHMFPYSSVPLPICSLTYMFPYSYVPLLICSLTHLFPYSSVPLLICSLTHMFPYSYVPLLICSHINFSFLLFSFIHVGQGYNNNSQL